MDKFNSFIKNKVKEEKESFILPKSFEDKIETVLDNIDDKKKVRLDSWYRNRKFLAIASCFAFICFVLIKQVNKDGVVSFGDDTSPKVRSSLEGEKDNSSLQLYGEEGVELMHDNSYVRIADITLSLYVNKKQNYEVQGEYLLNEQQSFVDKYPNIEMLENLEALIVNKNEDVKMKFSQEPYSYKINLLDSSITESINYDEIKLEQYPSENLVLKTPSKSGIYFFEIIGNWEDGEIKYTIKIQVED